MKNPLRTALLIIGGIVVYRAWKDRQKDIIEVTEIEEVTETRPPTAIRPSEPITTLSDINSQMGYQKR